MAARVRSESAPAGQRLRDRAAPRAALLRQPGAPPAGPRRRRPPRRWRATGREIRYSPQWIAETDAHVIETRDRPGGAGLCAQAPHAAGRTRPGTLAARLPAGDPRGCCGTPASPCRPTPRPGTGSASRKHTTACRSRTKTNPATAIRRTAGEVPAPMRPALRCPTGASRPTKAMTASNPVTATPVPGGPPNSPDGGDPEPDNVGQEGGGNAPASSDPSGTGEVMDAPADSAGDRRRRFRAFAGRHDPGRTGLGRSHAPGAQSREGRGQGAGRDRGDRPRRPCQRARLALAAPALHDLTP